jgi:hypothetical protein
MASIIPPHNLAPLGRVVGYVGLAGDRHAHDVEVLAPDGQTVIRYPAHARAVWAGTTTHAGADCQGYVWPMAGEPLPTKAETVAGGGAGGPCSRCDGRGHITLFMSVENPCRDCGGGG